MKIFGCAIALVMACSRLAISAELDIKEFTNSQVDKFYTEMNEPKAPVKFIVPMCSEDCKVIPDRFRGIWWFDRAYADFSFKNKPNVLEHSETPLVFDSFSMSPLFGFDRSNCESTSIRTNKEKSLLLVMVDRDEPVGLLFRLFKNGRLLMWKVIGDKNTKIYQMFYDIHEAEEPSVFIRKQ